MSAVVNLTNQPSIPQILPDQKKGESTVDKKINSLFQHSLKNSSNEFVVFFNTVFQKNDIKKLSDNPTNESINYIENLKLYFEKTREYLDKNNSRKSISYKDSVDIIKHTDKLLMQQNDIESTKLNTAIEEKQSPIDTTQSTLRQYLIDNLVSFIQETVVSKKNVYVNGFIQNSTEIQQARIIHQIASKISFKPISEELKLDKLIKEFLTINVKSEHFKKLTTIQLLVQNYTSFLDVPCELILSINELKIDNEINSSEWCENPSLLLTEHHISTTLFDEWRELFLLQTKHLIATRTIKCSITSELYEAIDLIYTSYKNITSMQKEYLKDPKEMTTINILKRIEQIKKCRDDLNTSLQNLRETIELSLKEENESTKTDKPIKQITPLKKTASFMKIGPIGKKELNEILCAMNSLENEAAFDRLLQTHYTILSFIYHNEEKNKLNLKVQKDKADKIAEDLIKKEPIKEKKPQIDTTYKIEEKIEVASPIKTDETLSILLSEVKKENRSTSSNCTSLSIQFSKKLSEINENLLLAKLENSKNPHLLEAFQHIKMAINTHDLLVLILSKGYIDPLLAVFPSLALDYHSSVEQLLTFYTKEKQHSLENLYGPEIKFEIDNNFIKNYNIGLLHSRYPYFYLKEDNENILLNQIHYLIELKQLHEKNLLKSYPKQISSFIDLLFHSQTQFQSLLLNHIKMLDPSHTELAILEKIAKEVIILNTNIKKDLLKIFEKTLPPKPFRYHSSNKIKLALKDLVVTESDRFLKSNLNDAHYHLMRVESTLDYMEDNKIEVRHGALLYRNILNVHWAIESIMHYQISKNGKSLPESIHDLSALYKVLDRDLGKDFVASLTKFNIAKGSHYSALEGSKKNLDLVDALNQWIDYTSDMHISDRDLKDFKKLAEEGFKIAWALLEKSPSE